MSTQDKTKAPVLPRWAVRVAVALQAAGLAVCVGALIFGSALLAALGALYLASALLIRWAGWLTARRNLNEMPVFGCGEMESESSGPLPPAAVIAPGRNEERGIEAAVRSMAAMDYPSLQVIVVDDHSTDATPAILDGLAGTAASLIVLHDPPMQPGWAGKQNAVWHAMQQVRPDCEWFLFTDADVVFGPTVLRDAVVFAERDKVDFVTCIPHVETGSLLEELVLLPRWTNHFECFEYRKLNDPKTVALGIGAFMLVRRAAYDKAQGHAAIASELVDDAALARLMKASGARICFARAGEQLRCRQYHGFGDTMRNLVRKQRMACHDRYTDYASTLLHALIQSIMPLPLAAACLLEQISAGRFSLTLSLLGVTATALYVQGVRSFAITREIAHIHSVAPVLHPISGLLRCWLTLQAITHKILGRHMEWRGRATASADRAA